jgi:hypothetical protein
MQTTSSAATSRRTSNAGGNVLRIRRDRLQLESKDRLGQAAFNFLGAIDLISDKTSDSRLTTRFETFIISPVPLTH